MKKGQRCREGTSDAVILIIQHDQCLADVVKLSRSNAKISEAVELSFPCAYK
jgi:hypothetical protein